MADVVFNAQPRPGGNTAIDLEQVPIGRQHIARLEVLCPVGGGGGGLVVRWVRGSVGSVVL